MSTPLLIYFHICCINEWKSICEKLFHRIQQSGLYERVYEIRIVLLGSYVLNDAMFLTDPKVRILFTSDNIHLFENAILNRMRQDAASEDFRVLYIHSKGVKIHPPHEVSHIAEWVSFMCHFLMDRYTQCLQLLDTCDSVGVNLQPEPTWHYSGNFWWSKASHIRTLSPVPEHFHGPEFWVTSQKGVYGRLLLSGRNHYKENYPESEYRSRPSEVFIVNSVP